MGGTVVGVDQSAHAVHALRLPSFIAEDVGPDMRRARSPSSRADELKHAADQAADTHPVHLLDGPVAQPAEAVAHGQHAVAAVQPEADRRTRTTAFIPAAGPPPCTTAIRNRCRPAG